MLDLERGAGSYFFRSESDVLVLLCYDMSKFLFVCLFSGGDDCCTRVWSIKCGQLLSENKLSDSVPSIVCWSSVEGSFLLTDPISCFLTFFYFSLMWNQKLCNVGFYRAKRLERWHWYSTCFKTLLRKKVARDSYSIDTSSNRDVEDRRFLFSLVTVVGVVVESVAFKF